MLGFSHAPELLILFVIAFMVFGPEKLPELARGAGRGLREFRRMSSELQSSLGSTLQEPLAQMQQVRDEVQQQVADVSRIANETLTQSWTTPSPATPAYLPPSADFTPPLATHQPGSGGGSGRRHTRGRSGRRGRAAAVTRCSETQHRAQRGRARCRGRWPPDT